MENYLHFNTSTNIKSLLGKNLVTDQIAAIFELVKNSYDADATQVKIIFENLFSDNPVLIIKDNGTGMNLDDIKNKWMVIGTNSKQNTLYSPIYKRPLNGDKGIGRFSVDRLGAKLSLKSKKQGSNSLINAFFDWNLFENEYIGVEKIDIPYKITFNQKLNSGVCLKIESLRDMWDETQIKRLIRDLRKFKSPFESEDNFKIYIDIIEMGYQNFEITCEKLEDISALWVEVDCDLDNTEIVKITINKDGLEYNEVYQNKYNLGPIKAKVFFFDKADKIRYRNRYSRRVRDFGNIVLYRNEFRIHPYGDPQNDWLSLDKRQMTGFNRYFGSKDLIGFVQTFKEYNKGLMPLTNRQGLIENEDFDKLKKFILAYSIKTLEEYEFSKFKKNVNETIFKSKREVKQAVDVLNDLAKQLKTSEPESAIEIKKVANVIKQEQNNQIAFIEEQQELNRVYSRLVQNESLLNKIVHQALLDLNDVKKAAYYLDENVLDELEGQEKVCLEIVINGVNNAMTKLITIRNDIARKKEKVQLDITNEVETFIKTCPEFNEYQIEIVKHIEKNVVYNMDSRDLNTIIKNLVSNSIKSLRKVERKRIIRISLRKNEKYIFIEIQDNGVGIPPELREKIFDPFVTTTQEFGGFGIGLTIVDDVIREYKGELELVDKKMEGACFLVKLRY